MSERFSHSNNKILLTSVKYYRDFSKNNSTNNHHIGLNLPYDHMYASNNDDELFIGGSSVEQQITTPTQSDSCRQSVTDKCDCESEVKFLKEFLLMHLDLIQQQNEDILAKESTIVFLQQENDLLKEKLSCMERSNSNPKSTTNEMTQGTTVDVQEDSLLASLPTTVTTVLDPHNNTTDEKDVLPHNIIVEQQQLTTVVRDNQPTDLVASDNKDSVVIAESMTTEKSHNNSASSDTVINNSDTETTTMKNLSLRRKRACSSSSVVSSHNDESLLLCEEKVRVTAVNYYGTQSRKKRKQAAIMTSQCEYVTRVGEQQVTVSPLLLQSHSDHRHHHHHRHAVVTKAAASSAAVMASLEVPHWRVKVYTDSSQLEGTENTEDDVYSKRHARLEGDERRRKRWDAQRLREQRLLDKLRQRRNDGDKYHQRGSSGGVIPGEGAGPGEQPNHLQQQQQDCHLRSDGTAVATSCVTTTANNTTTSSNEGSGDTDAGSVGDSFWPASQRDLHFIEMTDELPVAAFGAALPALRHSEFSLPWLKIATAACYPLASQLHAADTYRKSSITTRSKKSI